MTVNEKKVVLSGIRATGKLHLGNYFGALRYFVELSKDEDKACYFFIANLHTLTTRTDPEEIQRDLLGVVRDFISVGIDPEKSVIFAQSSVPETSELNWLLACLTSVFDLERMPHFKEKKEDKEKQKEIINAGLLTYPVLMAADILGPRANLVPVGEDQHPHVELARDLAKRFNVLYGETFPIPSLLKGEAIRVLGLDGRKMGKSNENAIDLSDDAETVRRKIRAAVTDPNRKRRKDPGTPEVCNIYAYHLLLSSNDEINAVVNGCRKAAIGCIECKEIISMNISKLLLPIQDKQAEVIGKGERYIREVLHMGGKKARIRIAKTVDEVKGKMGVPFY
ncbi:MAG: tryptophan--tRNA ligase [Patescibacteria group bacterium]